MKKSDFYKDDPTSSRWRHHPRQGALQESEAALNKRDYLDVSDGCGGTMADHYNTTIPGPTHPLRAYSYAKSYSNVPCAVIPGFELPTPIPGFEAFTSTTYTTTTHNNTTEANTTDEASQFALYALTGRHWQLKPFKASTAPGEARDHEPKWVYDRQYCTDLCSKYTTLNDWSAFSSDINLPVAEKVKARDWLDWIILQDGTVDFGKALWFTGDYRRSKYKRHIPPSTEILNGSDDQKKADATAFRDWTKTKPIDTVLRQTMTPEEINTFKDAHRLKL